MHSSIRVSPIPVYLCNITFTFVCLGSLSFVWTTGFCPRSGAGTTGSGRFYDLVIVKFVCVLSVLLLQSQDGCNTSLHILAPGRASVDMSIHFNAKCWRCRLCVINKLTRMLFSNNEVLRYLFAVTVMHVQQIIEKIPDVWWYIRHISSTMCQDCLVVMALFKMHFSVALVKLLHCSYCMVHVLTKGNIILVKSINLYVVLSSQVIIGCSCCLLTLELSDTLQLHAI